MTRQIDTIHSLIRAAGGDAELSVLCGLRPGATKKWARLGVPEKHWAAVRAATGVTVEQLHTLNEGVRRYRRISNQAVNDQQGDAA